MVVLRQCADTTCSIRSACSDSGALRCANYVASLSAKPQPTPIEQISAFSAEMLAKWEKGAVEHGPVMPACSLDEAMAECIDLANYAMTSWYRLKALRSKIGSLSQERLKELGIEL